ncbi:similar to Saccharomyces cerevisiae YNL316C PHA2 Prephenate dehydratase, catalyzes the conversion of prephanate to phenylpyruvate, which is a step in the phenylalanine biosynthesis pathway [Maudiozyma barnettii]|uniref:prephenate dehydratase n=1 Tax=Maudiozyma barnettii TaxID=61262 RepID=A0A8H2VDL1_9SACH|nr:prephenate dehydratase PHA2 [Kazachstania barnettii]CAB4253516.1 similar to Saccharomyces cerevisiae YNL316C PHA2 Prephenate dehydratase, catalyzes the conversion of prephanate to phenylpyruvate, which is a step in the phenylalanine biosynthesis pathway [Kazachstania barnettii]CAD1781190.1 similar to Saccharomyces cerevisiae YNL316C PHA2 Prephenate dehydratase, catalyzes the conversion of prephanate to phenylpyruvate, which is a step in the phenylalanine biosynthesis pathway [Kazachstania barn
MSSAPTEKKTVVFLGPKGTYSHQAAIQQFSHLDTIIYTPTSTIPECFNQLENNPAVSYAAVPLENSTNGQVVYSYDLLRDIMLDDSCAIDGHRIIPQLEVIGEQYVSITHCLISPIANINLEDIKNFKLVRIFSHPQVWGQVAQYMSKLKKQFPDTKFETIDTNSTSDAVLKAIEKQKTDQIPQTTEILNIAIAGETAAHLYDAHIIDESINDRLGNTTRFLILKKLADKQYPPQPPNVSKMHVNLLMFTLELDDPGSLVDVLNVLKEYSLNMSSISSRPYNSGKDGRKWQYIFYIEYDSDPQIADIKTFYEEINDRCVKWCLWGSFPRNERYYQ